jgi:hypothetical protein
MILPTGKGSTEIILPETSEEIILPKSKEITEIILPETSEEIILSKRVRKVQRLFCLRQVKR